MVAHLSFFIISFIFDLKPFLRADPHFAQAGTHRS
jgi:hypothetical protein